MSLDKVLNDLIKGPDVSAVSPDKRETHAEAVRNMIGTTDADPSHAAEKQTRLGKNAPMSVNPSKDTRGPKEGKPNKPTVNFVYAGGQTPQKPTQAMPDVHSTTPEYKKSADSDQMVPDEAKRKRGVLTEKVNKLPWQSPKPMVRAKPSGAETKLREDGMEKSKGGNMDIFKAMGVQVKSAEDFSMVQYEKRDTNASQLLIKSGKEYRVMTDEQWSRYGGEDDPRARLESQLSKGYAKDDDNGDNYGAKYLKNTHAEEEHEGEITKPISHAEVADPKEKIDEQEKEFAPAPGKVDKQESQSRTPPEGRSGANKNKQLKPILEKGRTHKWLSQDELLLKALDFDGIGKSQDFKKDDSIAAGIAAAGAANGGGQGNADLTRYGKSDKMKMKSGDMMEAKMKKGPIVDWAKEEEQEQSHKKLNGKKVAKKSMDALDELVGVIKGDSLIDVVPEQHDTRNLANLHENADFGQRHPNKPHGYNAASRTDWISLSNKNPFVKAVGKGGVVMDFGSRTGNPIADRTSDLLNSQATPGEIYNANYQRNSYQKALEGFVKSPEGYQATNDKADGAVDKSWADQLNKPMDQQVAEAFKKGDFDAKQKQPDTQYKDTTITLNGEVLKGMSETDAAVIEMMKSQGIDAPSEGYVADVSGGGVEHVVADCQASTK